MAFLVRIVGTKRVISVYRSIKNGGYVSSSKRKYKEREVYKEDEVIII